MGKIVWQPFAYGDSETKLTVEFQWGRKGNTLNIAKSVGRETSGSWVWKIPRLVCECWNSRTHGKLSGIRVAYCAGKSNKTTWGWVPRDSDGFLWELWQEKPGWKHTRAESLRRIRGEELEWRDKSCVPEEKLWAGGGSTCGRIWRLHHREPARRVKNERHPGQQKRIRSSSWRTIGQIEEESTIWARSSWMHQHLPIHLLHWSILRVVGHQVGQGP